MISAASHHFSLPAIAFRNHFLNLHCPLHFRGRELLSDGFHILQLLPPPVERTIHLLVEADKSHATDR